MSSHEMSARDTSSNELRMATGRAHGRADAASMPRGLRWSGARRGLVGLAALAVALPLAIPAQAVAAQTTSFVYEDVSVGEVPNAVAVANDGTIVASLFGAQTVAILRGAGVVEYAALGCSASDVDISPDASTAWAVCQEDAHLKVIDVAAAEVSSAGLGLQRANGIVYLADLQRLVIADLDGGIVVVSAMGISDYHLIQRIPTGADRPSELAVLPDGRRGYAVTDAGKLLAIDFEAGSAQVMTGLPAGTGLSSISLSRSSTLLYAGGYIKTGSDTYRSSVFSLDPVTGAIAQEYPLEFTLPGSTTIKVAAGHRSLSVATGLSIDIDGLRVGLFDIALDKRGVMGVPVALLPVPAIGSDVSRSSDGLSIGAGTVNASVAGVHVDDVPYPPTIRVKGRLTGTQLTLTGTTTGMQPGTVVTVEIRDARKEKSRYVVQSKTVRVDARGSYRWTGTVKSTKVQVVTRTTTPAVSPPVTIVRVKR